MQIVIVEWIDVFKTMSDDSFNADKDIDSLSSLIRTIGWSFKETAKTLMLVQEFDDGQPHDWIVIPKCLIRKIIVVSDAE